MNLEELLKGRTDSIDIEEVYSFDEEYLEDSEIKRLDNIKVSGRIYKDSDELFYVDINVSGEMCLEDSISLELVNYQFSIEINEKLEEFLTNNENTLDIMEFLWQNIVLEVPLRYTNVDNISKYSGDGWKLIDESDTKKTNNPFESLLNDKE